MRTKSEHAIRRSVGTRKSCTVSFRDSEGIQHSVEIGAETLYEAAVLALKSFREHDCAPGPGAHLARISHQLLAEGRHLWHN
jgi:hypothetical protein